MFWIEGGGLACGYVFLDEYCYSVDYNKAGDYWLLIRGEPNLSACYHGPTEQLGKEVKQVLAGREVKVPVKKPDSPTSEKDRKKRADEVNEVLEKNRKK